MDSPVVSSIYLYPCCALEVPPRARAVPYLLAGSRARRAIVMQKAGLHPLQLPLSVPVPLGAVDHTSGPGGPCFRSLHTTPLISSSDMPARAIVVVVVQWTREISVAAYIPFAWGGG